MINLFGSVKKLIVKKVVKSRIQKINLRELTGIINQFGMMYSDIFKAMGAGVDAMEATLHENADEVATIVADLAGPAEHTYNKCIELFEAVQELTDAYEKQPNVGHVMAELSTNCGESISDYVEDAVEDRSEIMAKMGKSFLATFIENLDIPDEVLEQKKGELVQAGILPGGDDPDEKNTKVKKTAKKKTTKKKATKSKNNAR